mgnify:CR=1 FL=1
MKTGSIYTDMIKPLEKQLYSVILSLENDERQAIDKISPHCRDIYYDSINLQGFQEIRKNISSIAEVVILVSLWKDMSIRNFSFLIPGGLVVFFTRDTSLTFWPNTVYWCISKRDVGIELPEWSSVAKGKMTPEAFAELLKAKKSTKKYYTSCSVEISYRGEKIKCNSFQEPELMEPYNRSKHGDEIDMLMDDKGTTQRFKIGEDGQPIFPKSDAMGPETVREIAKSLETHPMCTSGAASVSEDGCSVTITSTEKCDCQNIKTDGRGLTNKKVCPNGLDDFFFETISHYTRADVEKWDLNDHNIAVLLVEREFEHRLYWCVQKVYLCYEGGGYNPDSYHEVEVKDMYDFFSQGILTGYEFNYLKQHINMRVKELEENPNAFIGVDTAWKYLG